MSLHWFRTACLGGNERGALALEDETNQVKDGVVTITYGSDGNTIQKVTFAPEDEETKEWNGKVYDITNTEKLTNEASD